MHCSATATATATATTGADMSGRRPTERERLGTRHRNMNAGKRKLEMDRLLHGYDDGGQSLETNPTWAGLDSHRHIDRSGRVLKQPRQSVEGEGGKEVIRGKGSGPPQSSPSPF